MGTTSKLNIVASDDSERTVTVDVSKPKGKKLHFVEPTLVQSKIVGDGIGYLKVAMFPGMIGVDVANEISKAVVGLGQIRGLIIDLRGNTGGGAGALRLMSLLTPEKIPVGFAPGKRWAGGIWPKRKTHFHASEASRHPRRLFGCSPCATCHHSSQNLRSCWSLRDMVRNRIKGTSCSWLIAILPARPKWSPFLRKKTSWQLS